VLPVLFAHVIDGDDVGMFQVGRRFGLDIETSDVFLGGQIARQYHLQRNDAVSLYLAGLVNDAHATASDLAQEFVVAEPSQPLATASRGRWWPWLQNRGIQLDCVGCPLWVEESGSPKLGLVCCRFLNGRLARAVSIRRTITIMDCVDRALTRGAVRDVARHGGSLLLG